MKEDLLRSRAYAALSVNMADNRRFFRLLAAYLEECSCLVTPALVRDLTSSCSVSAEEAFCAILSADFGLSEEEREEDRRLYAAYLRPSMRELSAAVYENDPYYRDIHIPDRRVGRWHITHATYAPYEGFICGPLTVSPDYREIPPLGYFSHAFSYPMVLEDGVEWMAIKPNEVETMRAPLAAMHGRVLTYGLGLGYFAYMAALRADVESVTVVERDAEVISLFEREILPQFSVKNKIRVICADAFAFAQGDTGRGYDSVFVDLWHDAGDGLPLYLRMRKIEEEKKDPPYRYWIEDMLLSRLRGMVYDSLARPDGPAVSDMRQVETILSDGYLHALAPDLKAVEGENV